jgi:hypothetical protein
MTIDRNLADPRGAREIAVKLLNVYDYARAQVILSSFGVRRRGSGPFLIARKAFSGDSDTARLTVNIDMSRVAPNVVWDWTKAFCILATQEPSWTEATLRRLAEQVRNIAAVAFKNKSAGAGEFENAVQVLKFP